MRSGRIGWPCATAITLPTDERQRAIAAAFGLHVFGGGAYEMRTVGALALRTGFWVVVSLVAWRSMRGAGAATPLGAG